MAIHMSERGSSTESDQRTTSAKAGTYEWPFICQSVDRARIRSAQHFCQGRNICMAIHMSERRRARNPLSAALLPRPEHMHGHSYVRAWIELRERDALFA